MSWAPLRQFHTLPENRTIRMTIPRWARIALALLVVPVVVFSNSQTAAAATAGPWRQFKETIPLPVVGGMYGGNGTCTFNAQHAGTAVNIGSGGWCHGLGDVTPGSTQPMEAGSSIGISFSGQARTGGECNSSTYSATLGQHPSNGTLRVAGTIPSGSVSLPPLLECDITQVCVYVNSTENPCFTFPLPYPEEEEEVNACVNGTPRLTNVRIEETDRSQYSVRYHVVGDVVIAGETGLGLKWNASVRRQVSGSWGQNGNLQQVDRLAGQTKLTLYSVNMGTDQPTPTVESLGPFGVQFSAPMNISGVTWNTTPDNLASTWASAPYPPGRSANYGGWTDPEHCRFWIGPKVLDVAGLDGDEPAADIDEAPPEPNVEPVVDPPPVIDPGSEFDWLQAIWAVLKSILNVLGGLASAIANAIMDALGGLVDLILEGLEALFVPSNGFMDDSFSDVQSDWERTSVMKWTNAVTDLSPGSTSGCSGVPLNVSLPGGVEVDEHIGAACSGAMATAASIVRICLTAVLVIGGAFACMRALGSGFGWQPTTGKVD